MTITSKLSAAGAVLLSFGIAITPGKLRGARQYHKEGVPQRTPAGAAPASRTRRLSLGFCGDGCVCYKGGPRTPGQPDQCLRSGCVADPPAPAAWLSHF